MFSCFTVHGFDSDSARVEMLYFDIYSANPEISCFDISSAGVNISCFSVGLEVLKFEDL